MDFVFVSTGHHSSPERLEFQNHFRVVMKNLLLLSSLAAKQSCHLPGRAL